MYLDPSRCLSLHRYHRVSKRLVYRARHGAILAYILADAGFWESSGQCGCCRHVAARLRIHRLRRVLAV